MFRTRKQATFRSWHVQGHPQVVEYDQDVLGEIVAAVGEGFRKFPHGGIEVGGVLFGEGNRHLVRILASRPIPCEHASGPPFTLSDKDQRGLAGLLESYRDDPELRNLVPVGWYQSHSWSGLRLDEAARALHEHHFPEPWQIALVFRPVEGKPTTVGIFIRREDGGLSSEPASYVEDLGEPIAPPPAVSSEPPAPVARAAPPSPEPVARVPVPLESYAAAHPGRGRRKLWKRLGLAAGLVALAASLWAINRWLVPPEYWQAATDYRDVAMDYARSAKTYWFSGGKQGSAPELSLQTFASGKSLAIRWNPAAEALHNVSGGLLQINDGERTWRYRLDPADLWKGSISCQRDSGDVGVRLTVFRSNSTALTEATRFLGPPVGLAEQAGEGSPPASESLVTEAEQLRTALSLRTEETKTLESALRTFRESRRNRVAEKPKPSPPVTLSQTPPALVQKSPTSSPKPALLEQRPPAAAPAGAATAPATRQVPAQTPSGRLIWTGFLPAGQVLTVSGGRPSTGNLSGKLPGGPVRVTVHPAELSGNGLTIYTGESRYSDRLVIEEPGPRNSWTRTTIEYDPERAATAETAAVPAQSNNWQQFSVRAIDHPLSVIVIDWERLR